MNGAGRHLLAASLAALAAFQAPAALRASADRVKVGYFFMPGLCEKRAGGRVEGFAPAWVEKVADAAGWDVERIDCASLEDGLAKLKSGELDVMPAVPYTEARGREIIYSHIHCGMLKNYLFVLKESKFDSGDPAGWTGISVGVIKGSNLAQTLPRTRQIKEFQPVLREYASHAEAVSAVLAGKCQAVATCPNRELLSKFKSLMELPGSPLFFCVSPYRPDLADEVDRAMTAVYDGYPKFDHILMSQCFPPVGMGAIPISAAETEWVNKRRRDHRPVVVELSPERPPLKFLDDGGNASGFLGRLLREVSRMTKLEFTCLPPAGFGEARSRFKSGKAEIWATFDAELVGLDDYGTVIPTISVPQVVISRAGEQIKPISEVTIAVDRFNTDRVEAYSRLGIMERVVMCDTDELCVKAVLSGDADAFVCSSSTAAECVRKLGCEDNVRIRPDDSPFYTPTFNLHVSPAADRELVSLMGKAVRSLSRDELSAMLYSSGAEASEPAVSIGQIWAILSIVVILVLAHMAFVSYRSSKRERAALKVSDEALSKAAKANAELRSLNEFGVQLRGILKMLAEDYDNKTKILNTVRAAAGILNADHATVVRYRSDASFERVLCWQGDETQPFPPVRPGAPSRIVAILKDEPKFVWPRPGAPDEPLLRKVLDDFNCSSISVTRLMVKGEVWGYASFMCANSGSSGADVLDEVGRLLEIAARRQLLDGEVEENRRELEKALSSAECAARAKTAFLNAMSHDIRTPLNAIIGFADLIGRPGLKPEEIREYSEGMSRSSNELLTLVNDVLDLSKLDTAAENQREGVCDFRKLFGEMSAVFRVVAGAKKIKLVPKIADTFPLLKLSEQRMRQVLRNLIGSAVKHTDSGSVSFSATVVSDSVGTVSLALVISDTGEGIPAAELPRVFNPFAGDDQAAPARRSYASSGLGLPIVKRIVEAAGGEISLDSREGVGTVFTLEFANVELVNARERPVATAGAAKTESGSEPLPSKDAKLELPSDLRVLVVDDVPLNLRILSLYIHKLGVYFIQTAQSGQKALEIMRKERPDIVFTDLWMPGMSGAELAAEIRGNEELAAIPIVAVTADSDSDKTFDTAVFNRVITKPVTSAKVMEIFASLYPTANAEEVK